MRDLADLLPDYEIASEHEHSNCVLIAHNKVLLLSVIVIISLIYYIIHVHIWTDQLEAVQIICCSL